VRTLEAAGMGLKVRAGGKADLKRGGQTPTYYQTTNLDLVGTSFALN